MSNAHDRRAPGTARMPFDAMVEMVGTLGPSYEAQAVNLSEEGMQLRGAYLPEVGQPVMCRFDAGNDLTVTAAGEVLWREDLGDGGIALGIPHPEPGTVLPLGGVARDLLRQDHGIP